MTPIARPKIFEPSIRIYDRPIHSEFFRTVASKTMSRTEYELSYSITTTGHVLCWRAGERTITEVLSTNLGELPGATLLLQSLKEKKGSEIALPEDARYRSRCRIEEVPPEFFGEFEREFLRDPETNGLLFRFGFSGRMTLGGVSYIGVDSRARELKVRAVHTFPDDAVFLRTETVFRCDEI